LASIGSLYHVQYQYTDDKWHIFLPPALMAGGRKKAATATPQHPESGEEGEESEVKDQQDSTAFLQKRVDNLDAKINKVLAVL